jgi:MFS family permease
MLILTDNKIEQLKQIYDYAKFHIGLYATVSTALIAIMSFVSNEAKARYRNYFIAVLICFLMAGIGGGLVASHIAYTDWSSPAASDMFAGFTTGTFENWHWSGYKMASVVEHYFFWLGIIIGVIGLWRTRGGNKVRERRAPQCRDS